jgi:chromosome partitioning protein
MARIMAVVNQKGGVGKTTTTVNLAASMAAQGERVLLIDLDPQGNATMGSGIEKNAIERSVYQALLGQVALDEARMPSPTAGYHVIPANRELAGAEIELVEVRQRELRLRAALVAMEREYDFILIDCPPALNLLTVNALTAAHSVIIPMQCEYYALEGLSDLVQTLKRVRAHLNPVLEIEGLLRTMFDPRNSLAQQVSEQLQQHFGDKVYQTVIPRNVRLAEAPSYGKPVMYHDQASKGALAYQALATEVLARARPLSTENEGAAVAQIRAQPSEPGLAPQEPEVPVPDPAPAPNEAPVHDQVQVERLDQSVPEADPESRKPDGTYGQT